MRETDRDWVELGEHEPFFGVLANPKFLRRNLTEEALEEFWSSGVVDIGHALRTARHHLGGFEPVNALDFGCGVGRLTRAMASHCAHVTGIDVSPGMMEIARRYAAPNMAIVDRIPDGPVDWVNSSIVFQHIPPQRGYALFDQLLDRVAPGGLFTIHVTIFKDAEYLARLCDDFRYASWDGQTLRDVRLDEAPSGAMLMYDYDLTRLIASAAIRGFDNFYMDHVNHGGCHGVVMYGRKQPG